MVRAGEGDGVMVAQLSLLPTRGETIRFALDILTPRREVYSGVVILKIANFDLGLQYNRE